MTSRHAPGTTVLLREVHKDRVWTLRPVTIVQDEADFVALYMRHGTIWRGAIDAAGDIIRVPWAEWTLSPPKEWFNHVLSIGLPDEPYSISLIWHEAWSLVGYYINVQEPFRRSEFGFDYMDWTLDIETAPDLSEWRVKDEDELEEAVRRGVYTPDHAVDIHAAAQRGIDHLRSRRPPLDRDWSEWRPDPAWPAAVLPERWE